VQLALCQRYYQQFNLGVFDALGIFAWNGGAGQDVISIRELPTTMRITPAANIINAAGNFQNIGSGSLVYALAGLTVSSQTPDSYRYAFNDVTPPSGSAFSMEVAGASAFSFGLSAELL
jgi:hypothetical protein